MAKNRSLTIIFLIVFIDLLGFGIILPLLPFIAESYSANPLQIGLLTSAYSLFQFISAPILGRLSDRYGRKKLLFISQLGSAIGFAIMGLANTLPLLFLSRIIDGITGGNISIAQAYVADITTNKNRAKGMGVLGAAFGLGFILGPAIGGILAKISFATPAYFAAIIALITSISTLLFLPESLNIRKASHSPRTRFSLDQLMLTLKIQPLGQLLVGFMLINLAFSGLQATFALWTEHSFGFGPTQNGYLFAFIGIVSVVTQLKILPFLLTKAKDKTLLKAGVYIMAIGLFILSLAKYPWIIYPALLFNALGNGLIGPTIQAVVSESVPPTQYGGTLGLLHSGASLGRIFGPIIAGELFRSMGISSQFTFAGTLVLIVALYLHQKLK